MAAVERKGVLVRLDLSTKRALEELARANERSAGREASVAIRQYLERNAAQSEQR